MDLFYSNYKANDKYVVMNEIDSKHIIRSFRKNIGDSIMITNGFGYLCNAEIVEIGKKIKVKINSIEKFKSSSNSIHIALSPLKNASRFEWFVEKSTELGISQITPLVCEYSEKKKVNHERLERISISSLKQSNQLFKPKINSTEKFSDFIKNNSDQKIMANLKTKNILAKESINSNQICLVIGPEGGFSDDEIQEAKNNKITEISFGENRLRSETAAIYGLSILKSLTS